MQKELYLNIFEAKSVLELLAYYQLANLLLFAYVCDVENQHKMTFEFSKYCYIAP